VAEELLEERVKKLERALESLAEVPGQLTRLGDHVGGLEGRVTKVESQISQLRSDIQVGFSAAGRDLGDTRDAILEVIDSSSQATQKLYDDGRKEMRQLFKETNTQMRVLHEDLVERIKLLGSR
jgi:hypothetical protein